MPKLPRDVSHDRLVRFLRLRGWSVVREGGRHTVMERGREHLAIPRHTLLRTGTLAKILTEAGVTTDEWADL